MTTLAQIKDAIESLSAREIEELLDYLQLRATSARLQETVCKDQWTTEEESDLQYIIPTGKNS
jgi:hypothetical protein